MCQPGGQCLEGRYLKIVRQFDRKQHLVDRAVAAISSGEGLCHNGARRTKLNLY